MSEHMIDVRAAILGQQVIDLVRDAGILVLPKKRGRKASTGGKKRGRKTNAERERLAKERLEKAPSGGGPRKPRPSELKKKKKHTEERAKKVKAAPPPDEQEDEREDEEEEE